MKAFPMEFHDGQGYVDRWELGMELSDYFAAKAMQGLIAEGKFDSIITIADLSYRFADAMIKKKKK